jgi:hypothetical protein
VPLQRRFLLDPALLRSWLLIAAGSILVVAAVGHLVSEAASTTRRWGTTRPVLVVRRPVAAGHPLAGSVEVAQWPLALVPEGSLPSLPRQARARAPLGVGQPITGVSLAPMGPDDPATGRQRVALPLAAAHLRLKRGDVVDVWATYDPSLTGGGVATRRVAVGAIVTSAGERSADVAVRRDDVADVARAAATSTITVVATG